MSIQGIEAQLYDRAKNIACREVDQALVGFRGFLESKTRWNTPTPFQAKNEKTGQFEGLDRQSLERRLRHFMFDAIIDDHYQSEINRAVRKLSEETK